MTCLHHISFSATADGAVFHWEVSRKTKWWSQQEPLSKLGGWRRSRRYWISNWEDQEAVYFNSGIKKGSTGMAGKRTRKANALSFEIHMMSWFKSHFLIPQIPQNSNWVNKKGKTIFDLPKAPPVPTFFKIWCFYCITVGRRESSFFKGQHLQCVMVERKNKEKGKVW